MSRAGPSNTSPGWLVKSAVGTGRPGRTAAWIETRSAVVDWVVKTVIPAMSAAATPCASSVATTGSKIASASAFGLAPSRTASQSAEGSTGCPPPVTLRRTTQVYVVFAASGFPGSGSSASTFEIRVSMSNLIASGTGVAVAASAQKTLSAREGASTGDAGRLARSSGPLRKKSIAVVVPKPSSRSSASSIEAVLVVITWAPSPIDAPLASSVPSPSPGRP